MHKPGKPLRFALALAACVAWHSLCHAAEKNLLANGDFQKTTASNGAEAWQEPKDGISYPVEDGNRFLRITQFEPGKHVMIYHPVNVQGVAGVKMTFRARWQDVAVGAQNWFDARIMMEFKDANHTTVKGGPGAPNFRGTSDGWQTRELMFAVPDGAVFLALMPSLFQAKSGTLDLDDWVITGYNAAEWKAETLAAAQAKAAAEYAGYVWSTTLPVPQDTKTVPLKVQGNRLVSTKDGKEVWLQGVALASMEWTAAGEHILESVDQCIKVWGVNVIRLAVKSPFWFGTGPWQNDKGKAYRELVDKVAATCQQNGVYLVIDLHEYRAANGQHAHFWKDVATRYNNHPGVIFGLLNEPHGISWEEWRNGGNLDEARGKAGVIAENQENLGAVESVGMQYLVDTVRKTGAKNLLSAGGLDWAYDLSGILNGYALTDTKDGQGIMYETHVYVWKSNWQKSFLDAAAKYPILVGEVGCQPERMSFIPPENHEMPDTWAPDMLGCIQKYRLNWTAWCFHPKSSPCLISDWNYTPTPYWGEPVMRTLKGEKFEMKTMR